MTTSKGLPSKLQVVKKKVEATLSGISSGMPGTTGVYPQNRSKAGSNLPPYYLVYFIFVELLGYQAHGPHEKSAWLIPIRSNGRLFAIEHRKMGLGIFVADLANDEKEAQRVADLINRAAREAEPFFEWLAGEAVAKAEVNLLNRSRTLFGRYEYLRGLYRRAAGREAKSRGQGLSKKLKGGVISCKVPSLAHKRRAEWLALSCIEAFFSWTEHVFIHLALLTGRITTAAEVAAVSDSNWNVKFKAALDVGDPVTKGFFDQLLEIRRQLRNFVAHGAFGKEGQAFKFHSDAGAVPVYLPHRHRNQKFTFHPGGEFDDALALKTIADFIGHLWGGPRRPAYLFIQQNQMVTILPFVASGLYRRAMVSEESMEGFIDYWSEMEDSAANME